MTKDNEKIVFSLLTFLSKWEEELDSEVERTGVTPWIREGMSFVAYLCSTAVTAGEETITQLRMQDADENEGLEK